MHLRTRPVWYPVPVSQTVRHEYGRLVEGGSSPEDAYDHIASDYDSAYLSPKDMAENAWLSRFISGQGYCNGAVLDVGCGTGLLMELCDVDAGQYVGVDVSHEMLRKASEKYPAMRFTHGAMESIETAVPESSIDNALFLFGVFSYAIDQAPTLNGLAYALRPGGRFFVMALSHRYPDRASYSVAKAGYQVPIRTYDPESLFALFTDHGAFERVRVRGLSVGVDRLNWMGAKALEKWYRVDAAAGVLLPERAAYVCVEGQLR